jgi:predicted porin
MKKIIVLIFSLLIVINYSVVIIAQCSDAGVCSVGGHSMEQENRSLFNVSASYKYGYSGIEDDVKYNSVQVGAFYSVLENTSFQLLIPYNMQSGPLGNVSGIGDLMVSATQNIYSDENSGFDVSFGFKLATGDDNKDKLPMAYQSGLGSNDVIIALNYTYDKLSVGTGYQFAGKRNNNFLKLKRGDDLLIRAGYNFQFAKLIINPQVLFIKRLDQSNIYNPNYITQQFFDIENSDQTQLNLLVLANYKLNNNFTLFTDLAVPFIKREVNVDGLTRAFSASVGVKFSIN